MNVVHRASLFAATALFAACSAAAPNPEPRAATPAPAAEEPRPPAPPPPAMREGFFVSDPTAEGVDAVALARLVAKAKAQHSEALVVVKNGKLVHEDYFGAVDEPIVAMSASKAFTSLAFGFLLAEGKLASLDERVAITVPGFAADPRKAKITYRQLLSQTSGLDPRRAGGTRGDIEANALAVTCVFEPGTSWQYSNGGIDLLAALAGKLAGKPMDQYLNEKLFRPMGIADVAWMTDTKGVPLGAGEMLIRPLDLAKVGQALLDGGIWRSAQVVPTGWPALSFAQSSPFEPLYGLLWWRDAKVTSVGLTPDVLAQWKTAGLDPATEAKLEPLVGRTYPDVSALYTAITGALTSAEWLTLKSLLMAGDHLPWSRNLGIGAPEGYNASGWLGQFLVIVPEKNLVAVRMRRARPADYEGGPDVDGFPTFPTDAAALAK